MACTAPSATTWRAQIPGWSDEYLGSELRRAWTGIQGPPYNRVHHDWTGFRCATLREARKRGLDLSVVRKRLGT